MRRAILLAGLSAGLAAFSAGPAPAGSEPFVSEINTFAYNFCPRGFSPVRGQVLPISSNTALFSLIGTNYGGDGSTTFALPTGRPVPTLVQAAPLIQCIAVQGIFPPRP